MISFAFNLYLFRLLFQLVIYSSPHFDVDCCKLLESFSHFTFSDYKASSIFIYIHKLENKLKKVRPSIHSEDALTWQQMITETKDLTPKISHFYLYNLFDLLVIGTLEFPNAQSYLSFASTDPPLSAINPANSGITAPLSKLVAASVKTTQKKKSPTSKNFPYLQMPEMKHEIIQPSGSYNSMSEPKHPQRQMFSPFIQQPGGTFDPKSIDFSTLQLPNTPPKTSRNKKLLHKVTSSTPMSRTSSSLSMNSNLMHQ